MVVGAVFYRIQNDNRAGGKIQAINRPVGIRRGVGLIGADDIMEERLSVPKSQRLMTTFRSTP